MHNGNAHIERSIRKAEQPCNIRNGNKQAGVGAEQAEHCHQDKHLGVMLGLFFVSCAKAAADDGDHGKAHGAAGNVGNAADGVGHRVGRNGGGAQGGSQAADAQLANLEHAVLQTGGNANAKDAADQVAVRLHIRNMADAERVFNLLLLPEHPRCGKHAPQQGGQRSAQYPHAQPINEQGVEADIDDVHDQAGQHGNAAVALRTEQSGPGVVKPDKGVGDGADQKVGLRKSHHIVINAAENNAQDGAAEHQNDQHDSDGADRKNGVQLGGAFGGFFTIAPAKVLAADDRAASCQGGQDLDDQNIQAVHQAHAGHSGFAHAGYHKGIRHAHGYRQKLLRQQRQNQPNQGLAVKNRLRQGGFGAFCVAHSFPILLIRFTKNLHVYHYKTRKAEKQYLCELKRYCPCK